MEKAEIQKLHSLETCPGDESASVTLISLKKIIHPPNAVLLKDERIYWIVIVIFCYQPTSPNILSSDVLGRHFRYHLSNHPHGEEIIVKGSKIA